MEIVALDGYTLNPGDLSWDGFRALGTFTVYDRTPAESVIERIGAADAILINKVPVTRETLTACPSVRYVGVLATGYNVVDTAAAAELGVAVTNVPAYGTAAVAQMTIALLLELCHRAGAHSDSVMAGKWTAHFEWCYWDYPQIELAGKTLGVIGFGRIGRAVARIAEALGMRVLAYSSHPDPSLETPTCSYASLDDIFATADVISLHCPLFPETRGLVNRSAIAKMKDGVLIVNTARGPLIVESDLREALDSGKVAGAAVDVVSTEPIAAENPLLGARNCIVTPHIAWASKEARARLMAIAAENLAAFVAGKPKNTVR